MVILSFYNFNQELIYKKHCVAISWSITVVVTRLLALEQQLRNDYDQQLKSTAQVSAHTVATQSSRDIYDQIINQVDVDHMAESDEL